MGMTVTRKGQVTIPKPIKPGSRVEFDIAEDGRAFLRRSGKGRVPASRFLRMRGTATSSTTDQIMALTRGQT